MTKNSRWLVPLVGIGGAVLGAAGVILAALITGWFNYRSHQNDIDAKMIELSIGILRAEPTPETTPLRQWAVDVMNKRGGASFSEGQRAILLKQELPYKGGGPWSPGFSEGFGPVPMPAPRSESSRPVPMPAPSQPAPLQPAR
jgi:hypothetical protein